MAKTQDQTEKPKKGGKLKLAVGALALTGAGAGGAFAAVEMGLLGKSAAAHEPDMPKLLRKGEEDPYAPATKGGEHEAEIVDGEGGSEYRTSYYQFQDSFTSNLKASPALIQVTLAASTRRDGRVLQWLGKHDLALRSAMLVQLAETTEEQATSAAGKKDLQRRLTKAVNEVLTEREGFGGVDNIYFLGYLVQ